MSDQNLKQGLVGEYFVKDNTFFDVAKTNPMDLVEKEIGDSKTPGQFLPQQKITRWDNECNVSVRLVHNEKTPDVVVEGNDVVWKGEKIEARFYDVFSSEHPEGASEFEIVLKEKPATNAVQFTVNDKDVEYFYQPPLTAEEIEQGAERPENVVGSYAVYAKTPKTNYVGGKEYKVGKVGHIYRPKIIDSAGTEVWGDLHIENGVLSVTIPQDFLDNATYPVRHAAGLTFGYSTKGASQTSLADGYAFLSLASPAGGNGTVDQISVWSATAGGGSFKACIWLASTKVILTNGVGGTAAEANALVDLAYTSKPSVVNGTNYYVGAIESTGATVFYDNAGTVGGFHANNYTTPVNLGTISSTNFKWTVYATYTAAGSTSPSLSPSLSPSISPSQSPSASLSPSKSPSLSPSISPSQSPSASFSPSKSPSISPSISPSAAPGTWYNNDCSWPYRVKVTALNAKVDADLTDFPVYVDLSLLPAGFHTHVNQTDARDIRVTTADGVTEVPREVVFYNSTADTGELHFKGTLANASDTDFYIYYGNAGASEPASNASYGSQNVWTNSFQAVYHLQQDPSGNGTDAVLDSTSNAYHLTPSGAPVLGTGKLSGKGIVFDGTNDQLKDTNQVWPNIQNAATVSVWSNFASANGAQNATLFRYTSAPSGKRFSAHAPWSNSIYFDFGTTANGRINGDYTPYDDQYSLLHLQSNGSTYKSIFINGVSQYSNGTTADNPDADLTGLAIGSGIDTEYHKGTLDEFRVATVVRTSTWISTEYNNQNSPSTFFTIGAEVNCGSASPSLSPSLSPSISPSQSPSASFSPSKSPSISPSQSPSASLSPSLSPSISPSQSPSASLSPSISPSQSPSASFSPSLSPSISPSQSPSASLSPSISPSQSPSASFSPSISPSISPSQSPSASLSPSKSPSLSPSLSPSISPSQSPSASFSPSISPSISPSQSPSASLSPSISPSLSPSQSPSASFSPSISPSISPSQSPSASFSPSISPSISPSQSPSASLSPSKSPSLSPSVSPSQSPSASFSPSISPSFSPSQSPSASLSPSLSPSISPSQSPSASFSPSKSPSLSPSQSPSASLSPSISPSLSPSQSPSASLSPSQSPSASLSPSQSPSASLSPSASPSESPSISPSAAPYGAVLRRWDGSGWVKAKLKTYVSGAWVYKPLSVWEGEWLEVDIYG